MNTVRSYFQPVESPMPVHSPALNGNSDVQNNRTNLPLVHVQQRTDDEAMWTLYPSFVLKWLDPENCIKSPDIGQWQYTFERETEKQVNTV